MSSPACKSHHRPFRDPEAFLCSCVHVTCDILQHLQHVPLPVTLSLAVSCTPASHLHYCTFRYIIMTPSTFPVISSRLTSLHLLFIPHSDSRWSSRQCLALSERMLVGRPRLWDYANLTPACSHLDAVGHETGSALAAKLFTFFIQTEREGRKSFSFFNSCCT